jgi:hypothetical protein
MLGTIHARTKGPVRGYLNVSSIVEGPTHTLNPRYHSSLTANPCQIKRLAERGKIRGDLRAEQL